MPVSEQDIEAFILSRKEGWRGQFRKDPAQAADLLRRYGKTSALDAAFQGFQQGAAHGFADETERAVTGGPAKNHILAQASNPAAYTIAQILGLAATGGIVRGAGSAVGKARSAPLRRGSGSVAAGGQGKAMERAAKAKEIESTWANFPFGKKADPRVRGFALDAAHGAALGYGGIDPTQDDDAFSTERMKRAGLSLGASLMLAPVATSMGVASTNLPLMWGGRRIGSKKMLEPQGVSKKNPAGNPRQSIEIARSMDESAARGRGETSSIARDQETPLRSKGRKTRELADLALEPVARERINDLQTAQRGESAAAIEKQYPGRRDDAWYHGGQDEIDQIDINRGTFGFHVGTRKAAEDRTQAFKQRALTRFDVDGDFARVPDLDDWGPESYLAARRSRKAEFSPEHENLWRELDAIARNKPRLEQWRPAVNRATQGHGLKGWSYKNGSEDEGSVSRVLFDASAAKRRPAGEFSVGDDYLDDMMEAFVRQDRPALESWVSTLEGAARRDPTVRQRVQAAVARQLAINERSDPRLNDTQVMREFLHALGMSGNKAKGTPNVLDAARGPARERHDPTRYTEALDRLGKKGPRMRPRHAEALRREMEAFKPAAYTGPWDPRMGQPLVLRGDDKARFISPLDFYRKGKVTNADVTATGLFSGPIAMGADQLLRQFEHRPEWVDRPPPAAPEVIEGEYEEVQPKPRPAGLIEQLAPQEPGNPLLQAVEAGDAPASVAPINVAEAQKVMSAVAGIPLARFGADGKFGPETQAALTRFQQAARIPVTGQLDELTARRLVQLRDGQLPAEMVEEIRAGLSAR